MDEKYSICREASEILLLQIVIEIFCNFHRCQERLSSAKYDFGKKVDESFLLTRAIGE